MFFSLKKHLWKPKRNRKETCAELLITSVKETCLHGCRYTCALRFCRAIRSALGTKCVIWIYPVFVMLTSSRQSLLYYTILGGKLVVHQIHLMKSLYCQWKPENSSLALTQDFNIHTPAHDFTSIIMIMTAPVVGTVHQLISMCFIVLDLTQMYN